MKQMLSAFAALALLSGLAVAGGPPGEGPRNVLHADKDGDGRVSRAEADAAAVERAGEWFTRLDLDKDGYVTAEETRKARDQRHEKMRERFDEHFKAADGDNDGRLSLDEVQSKMPRLAERFSKIDKDQDGFLTKEELKQGARNGHRKMKPAQG